MNPPGEVRPYPDGDALALDAAEAFVAAARAAVEERGRFTVALTGGTSPVGLYRRLATGGVSGRVPWEGVHVFWGDERCVPPAHPRSNFRLAHDLLLAHVSIPADNVHRIRGELPAERAATEYGRELRDFFGAGSGFDLVYLGLGEDGHVASLFPFDLQSLMERHHRAVATLRRDLGEPRVSLTLPVINGARRVEFLIPSAGKRTIAQRAMRGPLDPFRIPAQLVRPSPGELVWRAVLGVL